MIKEVSSNDLSAAKQANVAVLDFNATWCGPCKMLAPILTEISDELSEVEFYGVDVDENPERAHGGDFKKRGKGQSEDRVCAEGGYDGVHPFRLLRQG